MQLAEILTHWRGTKDSDMGHDTVISLCIEQNRGEKFRTRIIKVVLNGSLTRKSLKI